MTSSMSNTVIEALIKIFQEPINIRKKLFFMKTQFKIITNKAMKNFCKIISHQKIIIFHLDRVEIKLIMFLNHLKSKCLQPESNMTVSE